MNNIIYCVMKSHKNNKKIFSGLLNFEFSKLKNLTYIVLTFLVIKKFFRQYFTNVILF